VQNSVLDDLDPVAAQTVERAVAARGRAGREFDEAAAEVRRLMDAALDVMRRHDTIDPSVRDIVRAAGSSNQAFYRHFASKDALLLALIDDGRRRLCDTLDRRLARTASAAAARDAWVGGLLAQCTDVTAAAATRPFVVNADRLATRFPDDTTASAERVIARLRPHLADARDAVLAYDLVMAVVHRHLLARSHPTRAECTHIVEFVTRAAPALGEER